MATFSPPRSLWCEQVRSTTLRLFLGFEEPAGHATSPIQVPSSPGDALYRGILPDMLCRLQVFKALSLAHSCCSTEALQATLISLGRNLLVAGGRLNAVMQDRGVVVEECRGHGSFRARRAAGSWDLWRHRWSLQVARRPHCMMGPEMSTHATWTSKFVKEWPKTIMNSQRACCLAYFWGPGVSPYVGTASPAEVG